jgi:hypothetical protein
MPTDADWGRLYKFNTSGDSGMIMPFRSYYLRNFFAGEWTDMAVGIIFATCGNTGDMSAPIAERQSETAVANLFHFGLTKPGLTIGEVSANPRFMGLRGIIGGVTQITFTPLQLAQLYLTRVYDATTTTQATGIAMPITSGTGNGPFAFVGLRFMFNRIAQTVSINYAVEDEVTLANDAENTTKMTTMLQALSNNQVTPHAKFTGVLSVTDFSSYYIYWPYLKNRLKLHCVGAIKNG